ncbi:MAG: hypothetical protein ACLP9L_06505 [Thermoguttaceae bacterium]
MLSSGASWYRPQTMFRPGNRFPQAVFWLTACLLSAAGSGCGAKSPWFHGPEGPLLETVKVSELKPGCYCEIDMVVPPTAPEGSFDCYKGTVKEVNHDEVVLTNVLEESCIAYGTNAPRRPPTQQKRDLVRVPLTGVDAIWALPPAKDGAAAKSPAQQSALKLASSGAQPVLPSSATSSSAAEESGNSPGARPSQPALSDAPAHFDPQLAAGGAAR